MFSGKRYLEVGPVAPFRERENLAVVPPLPPPPAPLARSPAAAASEQVGSLASSDDLCQGCQTRDAHC